MLDERVSVHTRRRYVHTYTFYMHLDVVQYRVEIEAGTFILHMLLLGRTSETVCSSGTERAGIVAASDGIAH